MSRALTCVPVGVILAAAPALWSQDPPAGEGRLTGDFGERRSKWERAGFNPFLTYTVDGLRVVKGGYETGEAFAGVANFGMELDLSRAAAGEGLVRLQGLYFHGDDPTAELVGDFNNVDNIVAAPGFRLYQLTYDLERGGWWVKIGLTAVDEDFGCSETAALFINSAFGPITTLGWNSGLPIWPVNALGLRLRREFVNRFSLQFGLYDGTAEEDGHRSRGTRMHLASHEGALFIAEAGFSWGPEEAVNRASAGAWWHSGDFEQFEDGSSSRGNYGLHLTLDQALESSGRWRGFVRLGYAPKDDRNHVETHLDFGVTLTGLLLSRPDDVVGLGYVRTGFAEGYRASRHADGGTVTPREEGLELTYSFALGRGVWVQPDLQYLFEAHEPGRSTLLGIVRLYVEF